MRARGRIFVTLLAAAAALGTPSRAAGQGGAPASRPASAEAARHDAVGRGLAYLALAQHPKGFWLGDIGHKHKSGYAIDFDRTRQEAEERGNVGSTALAGLAFLAAGHTPGRGPYGRSLDRALDAILNETSRHDGPKGYISDSGSRMYEHAFATLFLSQVHGMSQVRSAAVRAKLTAAVDLIVDCQNDLGGWRYLPYAKDSDLSVTVCQLQALRAARDAGIPVGRSCIDRAVEHVRKSEIQEGPGRGSFRYQIGRGGEKVQSSFCIDAAAVTSLQSAGIYTEDAFGRAMDAMERDYVAIARDFPDHYLFYYGNFYAVQAFHHCGGDRRERFTERLFRDLLARQRPDGRWRNDVGPGDEFGTAMACLMLSVPDGVLPIFQK